MFAVLRENWHAVSTLWRILSYTADSTDMIAAQLLQLFMEGQENTTIHELLLSCLFSVCALDFLCHHNLKSVKVGLLRCLRLDTPANYHHFEQLAHELLSHLEDPTKLLPILSKQHAVFQDADSPDVPLEQMEVQLAHKTSRLIKMFRSVMEGMTL